MTLAYVDPEPCSNGELTALQVTRWRNQGYCLVDGLLPDELIRACARDAYAYYPAPGGDDAAKIKDFGSRQHFVFPAGSDACNEITLHMNLLGAVANLLAVTVPELRLTQSDLWPKYGRAQTDGDYDNRDQRIHCDYPNHTLTHPPPWDRPEAVEVIIYLADFEACDGATAVVPRTGADDPAYPWPIVQTPGVAGKPYINNRDKAEAYLREHAPEDAEFRAAHLYGREVHTRYTTGTVLLYRHDVWHRGTPVREGAMRPVHNLTFKKAGADWVNVLHPGWSWSMYHPEARMERLIARASHQQRSVLGFPAPGSRYWTRQTLDAVTARYAAYGFDPTPYEYNL